MLHGSGSQCSRPTFGNSKPYTASVHFRREPYPNNPAAPKHINISDDGSGTGASALYEMLICQ